ncbi:hypothetical protein M9H77_16234 [Catharanthus roseus]|uniref:Uncharacterized protein n=1 Tax=Catharanthus roseus TaxID=4058 RepID=A0ACC0B091_CATRO|nr:hypothetical protein M9H77_16234 [Catharanthus roseus]
MATSSKESPSNNPGLHSTSDEATKVCFQCDCLNVWLLKRLDFPELKSSLYFMGYEDVSLAPSNPLERTYWTFGRKATVELTHNWGTEDDPDFKGYHNGNSEPCGFATNYNNHVPRVMLHSTKDERHIAITVDDTYKACERFERLGVEFVKKPDDAVDNSFFFYLNDIRVRFAGKFKGFAFIKDPDGYWIEIFDIERIRKLTAGNCSAYLLTKAALSYDIFME